MPAWEVVVCTSMGNGIVYPPFMVHRKLARSLDDPVVASISWMVGIQ